jgi:hypothetical protein
MITEEALPTYMAMLNTLDGVRDETGAAATPWAKWTREWTAEENRHGDVMNKYMYLTGRWAAGRIAGAVSVCGAWIMWVPAFTKQQDCSARSIAACRLTACQVLVTLKLLGAGVLFSQRVSATW